jgi:hypothetical protein
MSIQDGTNDIITGGWGGGGQAVFKIEWGSRWFPALLTVSHLAQDHLGVICQRQDLPEHPEHRLRVLHQLGAAHAGVHQLVHGRPVAQGETPPPPGRNATHASA